MNSSKKHFLFLFLVSALILSGCGAPAAPIDEQSVLATMVAATVEAALGEPQPEMVVNTPEPTDVNLPAPTLTSPRALQVAYIKDGNVYIWTEGESSVGLTSTHDADRVSISDDGQIIVFVRRDPNNFYAVELWAVNTSGPTNARMLVSYAEMDALKAASPFPTASGLGFDGLAWRPGTHQIAYSTAPRFEGPGYVPFYDLRVVNVDTLAKTTIFDFGQGGAFTFSPDGMQIVLSTPDHISLANADGSNLRANVLTYPLVGTYSEYQYHPSPIWASDSASLRVAIPPEDTLAEPTPPTSAWYIPIDGSAATQLSSFSAIPFDWPINAFSPDMSYIAYVKSVGESTANQRELHLANPDGSGDYVFAVGNTLRFSQWTPDGTRFVFSINGVDNQGLYLGNISGGTSIIASIPQSVNQMRWVDNSRFLYFQLNQSDAYELRISHVGGTRHAFIDTFTEEYTSFDFTQ